MAVVALVIAFFGVFPLALLGFEISRFFLVQSELQHVLDAAALSGTAALASSPAGLTVIEQQQLAMQTAVYNFEQNSVLQTNFNSGNTSANLNTAPDNSNPSLHNAIINITLYDQDGNPQPTGSSTATVMRIAAAYTEQPSFSGSTIFNPIQSLFTARAFSTGGLPQLDLALCFDVSGSMDDETVVYFVRREWSGKLKRVHYVVQPQTIITGAVAPYDTSPSIYNMTYPPETGTSLNATWPQNLSFASYANTAGGATYSNPYVFSEGYYALGTNPLIGLRALTSYPAGSVCPDQGRPPGNYLASFPSSEVVPSSGKDCDILPTGFTDMVCVPPSYNVQSAVEASRGNLNSAAYLSTSMGGTTYSGTVSSELTGYTISPTAYSDYWTAVNNTTQPINYAKAAAVQFFNLMNTSSNAHFMLETFSTTAGTSPTGVYTDPINNPSNYNSDGSWSGGGVGVYPLPLIDLNASSSQLTQCINAVQGTGGLTSPGLVAEGKTDIGDALQTAYNELTSPTLSRSTAKKAIILFTDGIPNVPSAAAGAILPNAVAAKCKLKGIPIYTIGLSTNEQVVYDEGQFLGDGVNGGPGIAYKSGNNATYSPVSTPAALTSAFQSIARGLVVLQQ